MTERSEKSKSHCVSQKRGEQRQGASGASLLERPRESRVKGKDERRTEPGSRNTHFNFATLLRHFNFAFRVWLAPTATSNFEKRGVESEGRAGSTPFGNVRAVSSSSGSLASNRRLSIHRLQRTPT